MKFRNLSYQKKSLLTLGLVMAFIGIWASLMMIPGSGDSSGGVLSENVNTDVTDVTAAASLAVVDLKVHASTTIPVQIMIPKIALNAKLEYVGLTADGAMGTPKNPVNAAWFALGPRPGEKGNAVIDG